jgi:hypothetical protein
LRRGACDTTSVLYYNLPVRALHILKLLKEDPLPVLCFVVKEKLKDESNK